MNLIILLFCCLILKQISAQFDLQYIGDYVTHEDEAKRQFCDTKYCLLDADNLFNAATQNVTVQPCSDFKEFALGTFIKYRAINDRDRYNGFLLDVQAAHHERQRKILAAKVDNKDTQLTKSMKIFFSKCVDSGYVRRNGIREMREYLKSMGLNFYPEKKQSDFNLSKLFERLPEQALSILLSLKLERCNPPDDKEKEFLCLRQQRLDTPELWYLIGYEDMLFEMNRVHLNSSFSDKFRAEFRDIAQKQYLFYKLQDETIRKENSTSELISISNLKNLTSSLDIDWFKVINNQLLTKTEDVEVMVMAPQTIKNLADLIANTDQKTLADFVVYDFLYHYRPAFIVYKHDEWETSKRGSKKSLQRWTQCVSVFYFYMSCGLEFLYSRKYRDEKVEKAAKEFAQEAVNFAILKIEKGNRLNDTIKQILVDQLKTTKIASAFPDDVLDPLRMETFYENLKMNDEGSVESSLEINNFNQKIKRESKQSWRRKLNDLTVITTISVKYSWNDNLLYLPSVLVHFPYYHPERPRFFNTATLFADVIIGLKNPIRNYLKDTWNITDFDLLDDYFQTGYENYVEWEESGGIDLQLGANRLTNRQLYWVAAARKHFVKFQPIIPTTFYPNRRQESESLNTFFKTKPGFLEAFNCKVEN